MNKKLLLLILAICAISSFQVFGMNPEACLDSISSNFHRRDFQSVSKLEDWLVELSEVKRFKNTKYPSKKKNLMAEMSKILNGPDGQLDKLSKEISGTMDIDKEKLRAKHWELSRLENFKLKGSSQKKEKLMAEVSERLRK